MRQAVIVRPGEIKLGEAKTPMPGSGQVRIRIQRIGVCGSDIHVYRGEHPFVKYPLVQGHEYSGFIDVIGENVEGFNVGDKVTATPQEVCGDCAPCGRGQYNACEDLRVRGFQAPGCAQDHFVTEVEKLIRLPSEFKPEEGAFVEPVAVAAHSTARAGDLRGKNVVVSGAGTIGNFVAQACKCRGASKVLIADVSEYRLNVAKAVGIDATCNVTCEPLAEGVRRVFGDRGFEVGAEVAGAEPSLKALVSAIGKGGTLLIIGVFGEPPIVDMSVICEHELNVKGSMMYRHGDFEQAVEWISSGEIQTAQLVSKHFDFEDFPEAYKFIESEGDRAMKVMIDVG